MSRHIISTLALAAVIATGAACSNEAERDAERTEDRIEGQASEAAAEANDAMHEAGDAASAATETADIKLALSTDDAVDASDINVDTNGSTKVVTLKGTVATDAQKSRAETIAKREAEGYTVDNQLTVRAH